MNSTQHQNNSTATEVDYKATDSFLNRLFPERAINTVLLVNPPDADETLFRTDIALRGRYTNYPPYGLAVLAANLKAAGISVQICNLNHEILKKCHSLKKDPDVFDFDKIWHNKLADDIAAFKPDLVGVGCMFSMTHTSFEKVCKEVKKHNLPLVIGGVHVSNDLDRLLDDVTATDIAIYGEGDLALVNLIQVVNRNKDHTALGQIVFNDTTGRQSFSRNARPSAEEISTIPAYELLDVTEYAKYGVIGAFYCFKPPATRFATVLSNRGCRGNCSFCSVRNFNGKGVRHRSISSVIDEIELLNQEYGVGHIMWLDDDLFFDHSRAIAMFNELSKRNLPLTWDATNGVVASSCTDEVIAAAAESGCIALNIGVESGNMEILKTVRKPSSVKHFLKAAEVLRRFEKIHASVFLMLGFPNETMAMIMDTINLAREMDLDWYRISQLHPLPNTPVFEAMVSQGLIKPLGDKETRFNGGAFGKQAELEQGLRLATTNFKEAFSAISFDAVPTPDQLTDIWFFMNYHLNFHRIFKESRLEKIHQLTQHLETLADKISPENGFALYFLGYLQHKEKGEIHPEIIDRLKERLASSSYWKDRLAAFGLSVQDLVSRDFTNKETPHLLPGQGKQSSEKNLSDGFRQDTGARSTSYFATHKNNGVDMDMIAKLKELSVEKGRKENCRICLHSSPASEFHNMVILEYKDSRYYRPHKHKSKQEAIHLIEGRAAVIIFTDKGEIEQIMPLGTNKMIIARLAANTYHTVIPLSDQVIYHESKPGPFVSEKDSLYPDWAPDGTDDNKAKAYIATLIKMVS